MHLSDISGVADMVMSGSGEIDARVDLEHRLKAVISGSGNVFYGGMPIIKSHVSGSGGVIHKN